MAVYFDEVTKYKRSLIQSSVLRGLDELNIDLKGKNSAFIKVNIVRPAGAASCVVTHPVVTEAIVNVLREAGIRDITIGDGPAVGVDVDKAFRKSGYFRLARKMGVKLLNINSAETVEKEWDYGRLELPVDILSSDLYVNVAKMKTHFHTGVTLSIKNQQGLLTPPAKKANHCKYDLHHSLVSIAKVIQPDLVIVDGIHSMEGEGPTKGSKKLTCVMVYGKNMLETDIACCNFMKVNHSEIEHLNYAIQEKMGPAEPNIKGEAFSRNSSSFLLPSPKPKQILNFYSWKNYNSCAEDEHSFEEAIHFALTRPKYWFTFFPKFFYFVLFDRFDLLRGKRAKIPEDTTRILCIGNCCKDIANKHNTYFVPGCPPKPEDIVKTISRMK